MNTLSYGALQEYTHPENILETYFIGLEKRNREKYASYIRAMKFLTHLLRFFPKTMKGGGRALVYQYVGCRAIDDVIDNDFLDIAELDIVLYAEKRFQFVESLLSGRGVSETAEDKLISEAWNIAKNAGQEKEIAHSFRMIIASMQYDARRIQDFKKSQTRVFPSSESLKKYFYDLDIVGTGTGMLVYLGSDNITRDLRRVESIGKACRIEYNLHDFVEDLENGIVNITEEDARIYGITEQDLASVVLNPLRSRERKEDTAKILSQDIREYPLSIQRWIHAQVVEYHKLIEQFLEKDYPHFPFLTRQILRNFYLKPTQKGISQISTLLYA